MFKISKISLILLLVLIFGAVFFVLKNKGTTSLNDLSSERCNQKDLPYLNSKLPVKDRVDDLMSRMTEWEKIGQMALIEKNAIQDPGDIAKYNLGALLSGAGEGPTQNTPLDWLQMVNSFQSETKKTCLGIPLLYGIDAIHGDNNVYGSTIFPHFIGLGATRDPDLVKRVAEATAEETAATGIYWDFAPDLDVAKDIRWGRVYETFGSDTANVALLGSAYLKGLQDSTDGYFKMLADPKHFVGGGAAEYGTSHDENFKIDRGDVKIDEKNLRQEQLVPFQKAVTAGAQAIMVSYASWNGVPDSASHYLLTDVLKKEFGFSGFLVSDWGSVYEMSSGKYDSLIDSINTDIDSVMSVFASPDWYGVHKIPSSKYGSLVTAINAGIDMIMTPSDYKDFMAYVQKALAKGDITKERVDDAVRRILTVKFETGLFDRPEALPDGLSVIGSKQHHELAREAVHKSQVLLQNNDSVLPLSRSVGKIIVAGSGADNLGRQSGGWTVWWQGIDGNTDIVGNTILDGIKNTVSKNTKVEYDQNGDFPAEDNSADIGIVVVSERSYAEGFGDDPNPSLSLEDLSAIAKVKAKSKKMIVVIVSGRPLNLPLYSKDWDGIVASWLPGSEGGAVADVLFGLFPFTGTLPMEWKLL